MTFKAGDIVQWQDGSIYLVKSVEPELILLIDIGLGFAKWGTWDDGSIPFSQLDGQRFKKIGEREIEDES